MFTKQHRAARTPPLPRAPIEEDEFGAAVRRQARRVHGLKINVVAWVLGSTVITGIWVFDQWQANGTFKHFGSHEGNAGDWNPTLWAVLVGLWGLIVGIMALRVYFERPATEATVERETGRLRSRIAGRDASAVADFQRLARSRLEQLGRLRFHIAAWVLGMVVLTPLWALIEWQDNGGFERWGGNGQPGSWEPWILYVGGVWAFLIALFALSLYLARPPRFEATSAPRGR